MAIRILPYAAEWVPAVKELNQRLTAGGIATELLFPESHIPDWLPRLPGRRLYQEYFLAAEGSVVRGGYILKRQEFSFSGTVREIAHYRLPLSEGAVDNAYGAVAIQMLRTALRTEPLLFALGMGGFERPLPRMLKAMGWTVLAVPFYFRVVHPRRFLRDIRALRTSPLRRFALDAAAASGLGRLVVAGRQKMAERQPAGDPPEVDLLDGFSGWADELWRVWGAGYALAAVRDSETLNLLYPTDEPRFLCLRISRRDEVLGWAVLLDTAMRDHKQFGNLRVGTIADCLASPDNAHWVTQAAARFLEAREVDLIVSNQGHAAWGRALRATGFLEGPSNFLFAASPKLAEFLQPIEENQRKLHINRGDGDGPIHL